jgi:hypothetical protein
MRYLFNGQIWVYDDEVVVGPQSFVRDPYTSYDDDNMINLWDQLLRIGLTLIKSVSKSKIILHKHTWDAIMIWAEHGYSDMTLYAYLNRMHARKPVENGME